MIGQYLKNPKWLLKNGLFLLLAAFPVFGWFALVFMGKKSGRQQLTKLGGIYGMVSLSALFCLSVSPLLHTLAWNISRSTSTLTRGAASLQEIGMSLLLILWILCLIHTLFSVPQYYRYLALKSMSAPTSHSLLTNRRWRRSQLGWMLWCLFPFTGGLGLYYAGRQMNNRKLMLRGLICTTVSLAFYAIALMAAEYSYIWRRYVLELAQVMAFTLSTLELLTAFFIREDYLRSRIHPWIQDTRQIPLLKNSGWCFRNSLWQLWTFLPCVGGIGILMAGNLSHNRKITRTGVLLVFVSTLLLLSSAVLDTHVGGLFYWLSFRSRTIAQTALNGLHLILWLGIFCYGTLIRWPVLKARGKNLQGYASEFQRDLDLQTRYTPAPSAAVGQTLSSGAEATQPQAPVNVPAKASGSPVDINTCSMETLLELPGVGIVQARKAIDHRQQRGFFRDVEEFIDFLELKPHFAVKIFEVATASHPTPVRAVSPGSIGRRLDF